MNAAVPFPERATVCGLPAVLSEIVRLPVLLPAAVGVNVTEIVHEAFAARLLPHCEEALKSPVALPPKMLNAIVPEFVRVTVFAELATPST